MFGASPVNDKDDGGAASVADGQSFKLGKSAERTEVAVCFKSAYRRMDGSGAGASIHAFWIIRDV